MKMKMKMKMKIFLALLSIISISACCNYTDSCSCTLKPIKLDINAQLQDMEGKPLKIKGAELLVKSDDPNIPIASEKPLISDKDGNIMGKLVIGERDDETGAARPIFVFPKIDGYYFNNSDLNLRGFLENYTLDGSFLAYAKKNYLKLTITSRDSLVSGLSFHSHIGSDLNNPYIIDYNEYIYINFKKGMTQTIVVPSVRDAKSIFHFEIFDHSIPSKLLKNRVSINNDKNLGDFIFPPVDKHTVAYTLIINKL
jgi:hypothetical protein